MSNLLEKASILTTPTAYDNGKLLSVKPAKTFGSELVTNGSFDTDSDWIKQSSWSIANGSANCDGSGSFRSISQSALTNQVGKTYKISYEVSNYVSGEVRFILGGLNLGQIISANGVHTETIQAVNPSTNSFIYIETRGSGFIGSIDNVSVKEVIDGDFDFTRGSSATRVNAQGLVEDVASGLPRIDYTDGVGSWLFEPQSTNLITYSEDFSQSYWRKDKITVTDNSIISPSGQLDASLIQETVYTSGIPSLDLLSSITLSAGTYTYTFYVKNNNGRYLGISFGSNAERIRTNFDFNTNTFKTLIFNGTTTGLASFTNLGDYYRISITASFPSSTVADIVLMPLATDTYPFYAFQNSDNRSFYLWGAQLEELSYPTSYIPTNGSTVTRLQDAAFGAGSSDLINSTEGVLYFEGSALTDTDTTNPNRGISISSGSTNNTIFIYYQAALNTLACILISNGTTQFSHSTSLFDVDDYLKIALKYKQNDFALWVNGTEIATDTSGNAPIGLNELAFDNGVGNDKFYGKAKCVAVFKEALTDEELTCLTTI